MTIHQFPLFKCDIHGVHSAVMNMKATKPGEVAPIINKIYCFICYIELLEKMGLKNLKQVIIEEVKDDQNPIT